MDEPNLADTDAEDVGDEARPTVDLASDVGANEPTLDPGDSDLADAWWAQ